MSKQRVEIELLTAESIIELSDDVEKLLDSALLFGKHANEVVDVRRRFREIATIMRRQIQSSDVRARQEKT